MSPLLDIWRLVYAELRRRGGMHRHEDEYQLDIVWQRAHTRARRSESFAQKLLRRGNYIADLLANDGRLLHVDKAKCKEGHALADGVARAWPAVERS